MEGDVVGGGGVGAVGVDYVAVSRIRAREEVEVIKKGWGRVGLLEGVAGGVGGGFGGVGGGRVGGDEREGGEEEEGGCGAGGELHVCWLVECLLLVLSGEWFLVCVFVV